jgi:type IV pilus assembly protein PilM
VRSVRALKGPSPIAIDFGVGALKVLQLGGGEVPSLVAAAQLETPEELLGDSSRRLRFQFEALAKLVRSGGFKGTRAVCAIPAGATFCKHLQVPRNTDAPVGELVALAVAQQLQCDPNTLLCRHAEVRALPGGGKMEAICFASGRPVLARLLQAIKGAKLEPVGMHTELHAALRGLVGLEVGGAGSSAGQEAPAVLHVDLGRGTTKVVIARGERMLFARVIEYGGLDLDRAVMRQTQLTLSRATERRLEIERFEPRRSGGVGGGAGGVSGGGVGVVGGAGRFAAATLPEIDLVEPVEILTDEIAMCVRYHRGVSPEDEVRSVLVTGGEARHRALCEQIGRALRVSASLADPLARVGRSGAEPVSGMKLEEKQPGWAVAVGLCLSPTDL